MATLSGLPDRIDLTIRSKEDKYLAIVLTSGTNVGAQNLEWHLMRRKGQLAEVSGALVSGIVKKTAASGYIAVSGGDTVSGIVVRNSGQGIVDSFLTDTDTSGLERGNYWWELHRFESGFNTLHAVGWLTIQ